MIEILYEDAHIAVCVKPAGALSEGEGKDALPSMLLTELSDIRTKRAEAPPSAVFPVHRLDRDTEGLMVYALSPKAAAGLCRDISEGKWEKLYRAWLWGEPESDADTLRDLLYYDRARGKSFVVERERKGVKRASLEYKVIARRPEENRALVEIKLHTGRTHQIRVQFASRGLPLCADRRYGAPAESGKTLALCSVELGFTHPESKEKMSFRRIPEQFE